MSKPSKYTTEILIDIIKKFKDSAKRYNKKITFSQVAEFACKELGYSDIRYYHFARNKEVNKKIKSYNDKILKNSIVISQESNKFVSLNIEEFVKINVDNPQKLRMNMTLLRDSFENLYNNKLEIDKENKRLKTELLEQSKQLKEYKHKYKECEKDLIEKVNQNKNLKIRLKEEEEQQMVAALKSTKICPIEILNTNTDIDEDIYEATEYNGKNIEILVESLSDNKGSIENDLNGIFFDIEDNK